MTTARCPIVPAPLPYPHGPTQAPASPPASGPVPEGKCYRMIQNDTEKIFAPTRKPMQSTSERPAPFRSIPARAAAL